MDMASPVGLMAITGAVLHIPSMCAVTTKRPERLQIQPQCVHTPQRYVGFDCFPGLLLLSQGGTLLLTCDFGHGDACLRGGLKIHMVTADAGSQRQLQLWRLGYALRSQVSREEGSCDHLHNRIAFAWKEFLDDLRNMCAHGKVHLPKWCLSRM